MNLTNSHVSYGINLLSAVSSKVNSTGFVTQVVNPYDFQQQGPESAEAQSFILMAYAAYKEWVSMGKPGNTGGDNPLGNDSGAFACVAISYTLVFGFFGLLAFSLLSF